LKDVADDRETLVVTLEGRHDAPLHHGGDGASGSSVGTASPDLFRVTQFLLRILFLIVCMRNSI
jgi:partitioning defective protein 3